MNSDGSHDLKGTTIAVTGAGGLIGQAVVRHVLAGGAHVVGIGRAATSPLPGIDWISADLTNASTLHGAKLGASSVCIHLAGQKSARVAPDALRPCFALNTIGTLEVAEVCRAAGVRRIVFASTGHVYAPAPTGRIVEQDPLCPRSAYAASKVAAEAILVGYATSAGLDCALARLSNVYGGSPDPSTIAGRAIVQAFAREPIALRTHDAVRDFIHVDDAAAALVALAVCPLTGAEAFNVASEEPLSSGEVAQRVAAAAARAGLGDIPILPPEAREPAGAARYAFSTDRLRSRAGWRPRVTFDGGLDRTFTRTHDV